MVVTPKSNPMDQRSNLRIRPAVAADLPAIQALMASSDMYGEFEAGDCSVAEGDAGMLGFIRVELAGDEAYVRPIVVDLSKRGLGIGSRLVEHVLAEQAKLKVVARGSALSFYRRLGFSEIGWEAISAAFVDECRGCPERAICGPVAMEITQESNPKLTRMGDVISPEVLYD